MAQLREPAADGEFQDEERELMVDIGKALDMSKGRVNAVIEELMADLTD